MKPVHGLPDHRRLFFFSHVTNSIRVRLAPCVTYTYLRLSCKLIFGVFKFVGVLSDENLTDKNFPIYGSRKFIISPQYYTIIYDISLILRPFEDPGDEATVACDHLGSPLEWVYPHVWLQWEDYEVFWSARRTYMSEVMWEQSFTTCTRKINTRTSHVPWTLLLTCRWAEGKVEDSQSDLIENLHSLKKEHVPHSQYRWPGKGPERQIHFHCWDRFLRQSPALTHLEKMLMNHSVQ